MKTEYLKKHLASVDLSFLEVVKTETQEFTQSENLLKPIIENLTKPHIENLIKSNIEKFPVDHSLVEVKHFEPIEKNYSKIEQNRINESWEQDITELETYFTGIVLPVQPVKPNKWSTITNVSLFIDSHFATIKLNNGNRTYLPHLNRLQELKRILTNANFNGYENRSVKTSNYNEFEGYTQNNDAKGT